MFSLLKLCMWGYVDEKITVDDHCLNQIFPRRRKKLSMLHKINNGHRAPRGWREIRGKMVRAHINTLFLFNLFLHTEHSVS